MKPKNNVMLKLPPKPILYFRPVKMKVCKICKKEKDGGEVSCSNICRECYKIIMLKEYGV